MTPLRAMRAFFRISFGWLLFCLSFLTPRFHDRWVFIGWHKDKDGEVFADNAKYLFLHASRKPIESIWLLQEERAATRLRARGYRATAKHTLRGMWYALTASITVIDAHLMFEDWRCTGRTFLVQLWHGIPSRKIGAQLAGSYRSPSRLLEQHVRRSQDLVFAPSPRTAKIMEEAFAHRDRHVEIENYPRNDVLVRDIEGADIDAYNVPQTGRIKILYAPTFRAGGKDPLEGWDMSRLSSLLTKYDAALYVQYHTKTVLSLGDAAFGERIHYLGGKDIQPILKHFDIHITAYSSVANDFLLLDCPIIYDMREHGAYESTGLQDDFDALTGGPSARTFDELLHHLERALAGDDAFAAERARVKKYLYAVEAGGASGRVFEAIRCHASSSY